VNNEFHLAYSDKVFKILNDANIRVSVDDSNERLSYKIRKAQTSKVKTQIIIGDEEVKNNTISLR
jgi:threonyl-tRNA synthetase